MAREDIFGCEKMKCQDCVDKENNLFAHAKYVLVDYDSIRLLCQNCFDDYCRMEGELNLDFFDLEMDLEQAFKKISEVLAFRTKQYQHVLKENSELKKEAGKSEAIEALMREQRYIKIRHWRDGSVKSYSVGGVTAGHMQSSDGPKLALAILTILFPDEEEKS